jgi:hypothetical protein
LFSEVTDCQVIQFILQHWQDSYKVRGQK